MALVSLVAYVRQINTSELKGKDRANYLRKLPLGVLRGTLLDRKGRPLTIPNTRWRVIQFNLREEVEERDVKGIESLLGKRLKIKEYRYLGYKEISGLTQEDVYRIQKFKRLFPSIAIVPSVVHRLKCRRCFHTVGLSSVDGRGLFGLERLYDEYLRGELGHVILKVDAYGNLIDDPQIRVFSNPRDVKTFLDLDLYALADSLMKPYRRGAIFAFNPKNGEVYLVYSKPVPGEYDSLRKGDSPFLNRALAGLYPPGSTFKPLIALLALREGVIDTSFGVRCRGYVRLGRTRFRCWSVHGFLRIKNAIAYSCNVFFYNIGGRFGPKRLVDGVLGTGLFGRKFTLLPEEVPSRFPKRARYYGSALNYSIGQGEILTTPVFLAVLAGIIGRKGRVVLPRFSNKDPVDTLTLEAPDWAYEVVREGMLAVVERGTARGSKLKGFPYGGKTGTAQNPHGEDHSLFIAFAPYEDPTFAVAVVVENAGSGSVAAAPVASALIARWFGVKSEDPGTTGRKNDIERPPLDEILDLDF